MGGESGQHLPYRDRFTHCGTPRSSPAWARLYRTRDGARRERLKLSAVKEEVKARLSCFDVLGIEPRTKRQIRCPSPSHDDKRPSAVVWRDGWTCSGCGEGGDVLSLVATVEGLDAKRDFRAVLESAANRVGIHLDGVTEKDRAEWQRRQIANAAEIAKDAAKNAARQATALELRSNVMARLWGIVGKSDTYSDAVSGWLRRRAIDPHVAHDFGCRDWSTTRAELVGYLSNLSEAEKRAAGLCGERGWQWPPLRSLDGESQYAGLAFPVWQPGVAHPMSWRWRYETPRPNKRAPDKPIKCDAMIATPNDPAPLLGLSQPTMVSDWPPHREPGPRDPEWPVAQWREHHAPAPASAPIVFLTEGEPDTLSAIQCLQALGPHGLIQRAPVVGLCGTSRATIDALAPVLANARAVVAFPHRGRTPRADGQLSDERLRAAIAEATPRASILAQPVHEQDDCNDYHQRGDLAALVERQLSKARAKL